MANTLSSLIHAYQRVNRALISVGFPLTAWSGCRQWPTCSEYAADAVRDHGVLRGMYRSLVRVLHCHPLGFTH